MGCNLSVFTDASLHLSSSYDFLHSLFLTDAFHIQIFPSLLPFWQAFPHKNPTHAENPSLLIQSQANTLPWLALSSAPMFSIQSFASSLGDLLRMGVIYIRNLQSSWLQSVFGEAEAEVQLRQPWKKAHLHASPSILWDVASAWILARRLRLFPTPVLQIWELVRCSYHNKARGEVADHRPSLEIYSPRLGLYLPSPNTCINKTNKKKQSWQMGAFQCYGLGIHPKS